MKSLKTLLAVITGRAVVISKRDDSNADVSIGKELSKQFVVNSMVGAVKHLML